ncbi:MAG: hypothetical protein ACYC4P_04105 [Thermoanaerobaculia bacterium]
MSSERPKPPAWGPGSPPPAAPGGTVSVRLLPEGEEIILRATGWVRFVPAAFLLFWLCGWAVGELLVLLILLGPLAEPLVTALREVLPGSWPRLPRFTGSAPWPVLTFLAVWFAFWTWGGLTAIWQLLRLLAGSDRFVTRPGGFSLRPRAGPFGRTRDFAAANVSSVYVDVRRSRLVAVVGGSEQVLCSGTPLPVAEWLAARLRSALGLPAPRSAETGGRDAGFSGEAPVPADWTARPLPEGGVVLSAAPARSRRTAGCALTVAVVLTTVFVAALSATGVRREAPGTALLLGLMTVAVDLLCGWAAFARDSWLFGPGLVARIRSLGPWERRREVRRGTLAMTVSTDSDDDDWFRLEARGEGKPLKMANRMNAGPELLAFARYAARHSGFPLDVPRDVLLAAGELRNES